MSEQQPQEENNTCKVKKDLSCFFVDSTNNLLNAEEKQAKKMTPQHLAAAAAVASRAIRASPSFSAAFVAASASPSNMYPACSLASSWKKDDNNNEPIFNPIKDTAKHTHTHAHLVSFLPLCFHRALFGFDAAAFVCFKCLFTNSIKTNCVFYLSCSSLNINDVDANKPTLAAAANFAATVAAVNQPVAPAPARFNPIKPQSTPSPYKPVSAHAPLAHHQQHQHQHQQQQQQQPYQHQPHAFQHQYKPQVAAPEPARPVPPPQPQAQPHVAFGPSGGPSFHVTRNIKRGGAGSALFTAASSSSSNIPACGMCSQLIR